MQVNTAGWEFIFRFYGAIVRGRIILSVVLRWLRCMFFFILYYFSDSCDCKKAISSVVPFLLFIFCCFSSELFHHLPDDCFTLSAATLSLLFIFTSFSHHNFQLHRATVFSINLAAQLQIATQFSSRFTVKLEITNIIAFMTRWRPIRRDRGKHKIHLCCVYSALLLQVCGQHKDVHTVV